MNPAIAGILKSDDANIEIQKAFFHRAEKRLEIVLSCDNVLPPKALLKIDLDFRAMLIKSSDTEVSVSFEYNNIDERLKQNFTLTSELLKLCMTRNCPQCAPIILMSVWTLTNSSIEINVPERFERLMITPTREMTKMYSLSIPVNVVPNDAIQYSLDSSKYMQQSDDITRIRVQKKQDEKTLPALSEEIKPEIYGKTLAKNTKILPMEELKHLALQLKEEIRESEGLDSEQKNENGYPKRTPGKIVTVLGRLIPLTEEEAKQKTQSPERFRQAIADDTSAVYLKMYAGNDKKVSAVSGMEKAEKKGNLLMVRGKLCVNTYTNDYYIIPYDINEVVPEYRMDTAEHKRVELHLHTTMSEMDALTKPKAALATAKRFGHSAMAITDHGVAHAFPDAMLDARSLGIKLLYGVEGYLQDDCELISEFSETEILAPEKKPLIVFTAVSFKCLSETYFIELKAKYIGEDKELNININPGVPIPAGSKFSLMEGAIDIHEAILKLTEFIRGGIVVTHTESDFIALCSVAKKYEIDLDTRYISTGILTGYCYPKINNKSLSETAAVLLSEADSEDQIKTAESLYRYLAKDFIEKGYTMPLMHGKAADKSKRDRKRSYYHIILLAKNRIGLKNMYKLITFSHAENFHMEPLIPRSLLSIRRNGLILGSACERGEFFRAILAGKSDSELKEIAAWYDYLEIQPIGNNAFMLRNGTVSSEEDLRDLNRKVIEIGDSLGKMTVATGDVHFLNPEDSIYRAIIMHSKHFKDVNDQPPLYFKTTTEMLAEFSYLGAEKAFEVVVTNTNIIADSCEALTAYLDEQSTYSPVFEGASDELKNMALTKVYELYSNTLPDTVEKRLNFELNSIINNGYASLYLMAQRLVRKSNSDGYLVGSRGSVGSSFVAYLAGITEVNPLPPHYLCPKCTYCEFDTTGYSCGADMPDKACPKCGEALKKIGFDIPFETFLGFKGDKTPDIDLNFSGEYHPVAHEYTRTMFGRDHAFRAGVINTLKDKTVFGYLRAYAEEYGLELTPAEAVALVMGCVGVKKTTGQHPGGMVIIPEDYEAEDFLPLQYPANKKEGNNLITHFDFHAMHDKLVKLDILGHVDPTALRMLQDFTGLDPQDIPLDDKETMALFSTNEPLKIDLSAIGCDVGVLGIPEYGTSFVRGILNETRPTTIEELVRIAGLSHGTNVWSGNAQTLIQNGEATLSNVIGTRDDIMRFLISVGLDPLMSFKIMESVRKGKGLTPEMEEQLSTVTLPSWYIDSCKKIKYMFPRAHAAAYLTMAFRVAYYKMHYPREFYAVYFTTRADDFDIMRCRGDAETVLRTKKKIEREISDQGGKKKDTIQPDEDDFLEDEEEKMQSGKGATVDKLKKLVPIMEIVYEMNLRGIHLLDIDINKSEATVFKVVGDALLPPFNSVQGLGASMALQIVEAQKKRNGVPFSSIDEFKEETKVSAAIMTKLEDMGCFEGLAASNQLTLF